MRQIVYIDIVVSLLFLQLRSASLKPFPEGRAPFPLEKQ